jgi:hypothetical protein
VYPKQNVPKAERFVSKKVPLANADDHKRRIMKNGPDRY